jgi:hypothetical protein
MQDREREAARLDRQTSMRRIAMILGQALDRAKALGVPCALSNPDSTCAILIQELEAARHLAEQAASEPP